MNKEPKEIKKIEEMQINKQENTEEKNIINNVPKKNII